MDRQDKLIKDSFGISRPKPPPWPNKALFGAYKPQFDAASTHTDTNSFSVTPTISPLASPSTSPTTSTPSESFSATIPTVNKHCITTTRTTSNSAAPRHGRVSSEKSHTTSTPSEVDTTSSFCTSHKSSSKSISTTPSKYYTTITPRCHPMHRAESSIAQQSFATSKPVFFSISPHNLAKGTPDLRLRLQKMRDSFLSFCIRMPSLF